jgi:hypothetical protein
MRAQRDLPYGDFGAHNIVTCMSVTIDGVWIDDRIYGLFDTARDCTLQFTITYTL